MKTAFSFSLTWQLNKAWAAAWAHVLEGKHTCQSILPFFQRVCCRQLWQHWGEVKESHLSPLRRSYKNPAHFLISRTHFYIYEITNSGLLNPRCPYLEAVENRLLMQGHIFNDSCEGAPCRIVGRSFVMTCQRNQENFELEPTYSPQQPDLPFVMPWPPSFRCGKERCW